MILSAILLVCSTITGGDVGEFFAFTNGNVSTVSEADTPGGSSWFVEIDKIKLPSVWKITRNGTVTNVPQPVVERPTDEDANYSFDFSNSIADGDELYSYAHLRFSPGAFDFGYYGAANEGGYARYYAVATNYTEETLGESLWRGKAQRIGESQRNSFLASFEAYCERLYYASKGSERIPMSETFYGSKDAGTNFVFNLWWTNYLHRAEEIGGKADFRPQDRVIPDTHRILDRKDLLPALKAAVVKMVGEYNGNRYCHPGFVYRPGWILDGMARYRPDNPTYLDTYDPLTNGYMATSCTPIWWSTSNKKISPNDDIVPEFDWRIDPITGGQDWTNHVVTLAMFEPDGIFDMNGRNPCQALFSYVDLGDQTKNVRQFILPRDFGCEITEFMTNIFGHCAHHKFDRNEALQDRKTTSFTDYQGRRHLPACRYGVNQILSLLDRTYMIPESQITCYDGSVSMSRDVEYSTGETVMTAYRNPFDPAVYVIDSDQVNDVSWSEDLRTNREVRAYTTTSSRPNLSVYRNHVRASAALHVEEGLSGIAIDESLFEILDPPAGGERDITFIGAAVSGGNLVFEYEASDTGLGSASVPLDNFIPDPCEFSVSGEAGGHVDCNYEGTVSNYVALGETWCNGIGGDRCKTCKVGAVMGVISANEDWAWDPWGFDYTQEGEYKIAYKTLNETYSSRSDLEMKLGGYVDKVREKLYDDLGVGDADEMIFWPTIDFTEVEFGPLEITISATPPDPTNRPSYTVKYDSGGSIESITPKSAEWALPCGFAGLHASGSTGGAVDIEDKRERKSSFGRGDLQIMTQADWEWKTMMRKDD